MPAALAQHPYIPPNSTFWLAISLATALLLGGFFTGELHKDLWALGRWLWRWKVRCPECHGTGVGRGRGMEAPMRWVRFFACLLLLLQMGEMLIWPKVWGVWHAVAHIGLAALLFLLSFFSIEIVRKK
jgi:hypothetical protein